MIYLCDTNIISELVKPQPNPGVLTWSTTIVSFELSVITLEEIIYGLSAKPNSRIQSWFQNFLTTYCQIIPVTPDIAQTAGEIRGRLRSQGNTRTQADMLIAATAKVHQLTLVTRNIRDFEGCEISLLNPFTSD
ncbi:type II toxin-antitoxin system VapC family toxin [Alkalinema sp. FACHB-956]|uniref:type II toxin-antitoxin system VapC family toxin n=1 Tax=Alkalinema sp. FACHB-956 TaxID=2692768 RepID=UPI00168211C0|nr:type II toxin-antitoxin system VapC family toxin [Alkalinema sp. FACHB-956]MBD2329060.1 type II toxin-antitoxin system VapC family toxin [Alkalinema sp. FACHB-956]